MTDAVMAGEPRSRPIRRRWPASGSVVLQGLPFEGIDQTVRRLVRSGRKAWPGRRAAERRADLVAQRSRAGQRKGRFSAEPIRSTASGGAPWQPMSSEHPRRLERGRGMAAPDYVDLVQAPAPGAGDGRSELAILTRSRGPRRRSLHRRSRMSRPGDVRAQQHDAVAQHLAIVKLLDLWRDLVPMPRHGGFANGLMLVARNGDDASCFVSPQRREIAFQADLRRLHGAAATSTMAANFQPFAGEPHVTRSVTLNRRRLLGSVETRALLGAPAIVRAQGSAVKVGVLLPRSGAQASIGQDCQRGAMSRGRS